MRKLSALAVMSLLAMTVAVALVGCGGQQQPAETTTETAPPAETSMPPDTGMGGMGTSDTTMSH
jgi:hypothetical protein